MSRQRAWEDERGFTLVEMLAVILIMGVVFGIASSTWFKVAEGRRVDSATNQLAADLRLAHSRATNRLADQTVTLTAGNSEYTVPSGSTYDLDDSDTEDVVSVPVASTLVFKANGSALVTGANPITVRATNNPGNFHRIEINTVTSEIKVVP